MAIWTDIIEPETLTEYARDHAFEVEGRGDSLGQFLPNRQVSDVRVNFKRNVRKFVDAADFRAWDAAPTQGRTQGGKEQSLRLAATAKTQPLSEYDQLRVRNSGNTEVRDNLLEVTEMLVESVVAAVELKRAEALVHGTVTLHVGEDAAPQVDDFGRNPNHNAVAPVPWTDPTASRLDYLLMLQDVYADANGEAPGCLYMSNKVFRALVRGTEFATVLMGGANRTATKEQAIDLLASYGLPSIVVCERKINGSLIIPEDRLLMLPAPVGINEPNGTQLGATFWGQTLAATEGGFSLGNLELPGLVAVANKTTDIPIRKSVTVDAIALPVLTNPDLSLVAKVL